jgi:hypothetical protein
MVDTTMGTTSYRGNLAKEHKKTHLRLFQPKIYLHHLLEVLRHLGVHFHLGVYLHSEFHHLLLKVHFPLLVVFHSHEEDYHRFL